MGDDGKREWLNWVAGIEAVENLKQLCTKNALSEIRAFSNLLKAFFRCCFKPSILNRFLSLWCKNSCTA